MTPCRSSVANIKDAIKSGLGIKEEIYSIVFYVKNTEVKIIPYRFFVAKGDRSIKVSNEKVIQHEVDLSAYVKKPKEFNERLDPMLKSIERVVQKCRWPKTPMVLVAANTERTQVFNEILEMVGCRMKCEGFVIRDCDKFILAKSQRAIATWYSFNLLLDRLRKDRKPVATLNLGGSAVSAVFLPTDREKKELMNLTPITAYSKNYDLYVHSWIHLNWFEVRQKVLEYKLNNALLPGTTVNINSFCMSPLDVVKWTYKGVTYNITGINELPTLSMFTRSPYVRFESCKFVMREVLSRYEKAPSLNCKEIYVSSHLYKMAVAHNLIKPNEETVWDLRQLERLATTKCENILPGDDFLCMDLTYVLILLQSHFGLCACDEIHIANSIKGITTSWSFGAAFMNLNKKSTLIGGKRVPRCLGLQEVEGQCTRVDSPSLCSTFKSN
ncbi:hypothetical protein RUM43_006059 [Polyplax serrata]|uniref:Uncharacterized protein n=1 Tax=Polyplax serrata TaxID=468196 RepID=A0AAN8PC26_POLSC